MKTQIDVNEINVSRPEAMRRYLISAALIGAVLLSPATVPSWVALAACYPAFTALIQWDPVNALFGTLIAKRTDKLSQITMSNAQKI